MEFAPRPLAMRLATKQISGHALGSVQVGFFAPGSKAWAVYLLH